MLTGPPEPFRNRKLAAAVRFVANVVLYILIVPGVMVAQWILTDLDMRQDPMSWPWGYAFTIFLWPWGLVVVSALTALEWRMRSDPARRRRATFVLASAALMELPIVWLTENVIWSLLAALAGALFGLAFLIERGPGQTANDGGRISQAG